MPDDLAPPCPPSPHLQQPQPLPNGPRTDPKAVWSLVLGILGFIPFCFIFLLSAIAAAILGHLSLHSIKHSNGWLTGRGMALAGCILGYSGFVFSTLVLVLVGIHALDKYSDLEKDAFIMHLQSGGPLHTQEEHEERVEMLDRAIANHPDEPLFYCYRGIAHTELGQYDLAIPDFDKALALDPRSSQSLYNRGYTYSKMGRYDMAIQDLDKALELQPRRLQTYCLRADCHWRSGDTPQAVADLETAIRMHPDKADGYNYLAWILAVSPDPADRNASRALDLALKACSLVNDHWTLDTLAAAYAANGQFDLAVAHEDDAILMLLSRDPSNPVIETYKERMALYRQAKPFTGFD